MKLVQYITIGIFILAGAVPYALSASPVALKQNIVVSDTTLKLGDLFTGLEKDQDRVLGAAPRPGKNMVLNARTLMRIAIALDLNWRPQSSAERVVVRRAATIIGPTPVEEALKEQLTEKGVTGNYTLELESFEDIVLPESAPADVVVKEINLRPDHNWFEATLVAPSKENPLYTSRITGKIERITAVPVLRDTLAAGSIIGTRDIDYIDMKDSLLQANMVLDENKLIGMTPRRMITPGSPVKLSEIERPQIVARGTLITMIFKSGPLLLTAEGKALENGAEGDTIRVVNVASNKTLQAVVTGSNEVTLQSFE